MKNVYSVGQVNRYVKNMFTQDFFLQKVYVKGEVSNCKYHTSGHIYFSLKDETGTISCVMFAGQRRGLGFSMKDGDKVVAGGTVDVYERDGRYQLYAKEITLEGAGALYERFLALKQELEEMGMFAQEYKQPIPPFVRKLGVVTAPTGAAVQDIRNVSLRRNPYLQIILYPALVQGEGAAASCHVGKNRAFSGATFGLSDEAFLCKSSEPVEGGQAEDDFLGGSFGNGNGFKDKRRKTETFCLSGTVFRTFPFEKAESGIFLCGK